MINKGKLEVSGCTLYYHSPRWILIIRYWILDISFKIK